MKTSIYLPEELAREVRAYGVSISEVSQAALRCAVNEAREKEKLMDGMAEISVETGGQPVITEVFIGRWLMDPDSEQARTNLDGYDRNARWGVALTKRGRIAVYAGHRSRLHAARLTVFSSLEEAAQELPPNITREAAAALGQHRVVHRDI